MDLLLPAGKIIINVSDCKVLERFVDDVYSIHERMHLENRFPSRTFIKISRLLLKTKVMAN